MLDPLTAVSLASAIVQFVDFASKVIRGASEIYNSADGALRDNAELEDSTTKINQLNDRILVPSTVTNTGGTLAEDTALTELASTSKVVADELLSLLQDFRSVRRSGSHRKWESFRKAVLAQTPWNKDKIQRLESKLNGLQEMIRSHLLDVLRYVLQSFNMCSTGTYWQRAASNSLGCCHS
jgi:hypothetical protein